MRDATIPPTLEEHRLRERNAQLIAALKRIAELRPENRYYGRTPHDLAIVIAREALGNEAS